MDRYFTTASRTGESLVPIEGERVDSNSGTLLRPESSRDHASTNASFVVFALVAVGLGAALRFLVIDQATFPLSVGGLFYVMVRDIESHHLALPAFTSYNGGAIPFAYPPLGFYLVALLHHATGVSILSLFRVVPFVLTCLSVGAFALLARSLLRQNAAIAATFNFALTPDSFVEEIKGGGITRAPGELFTILAIWQVAALY